MKNILSILLLISACSTQSVKVKSAQEDTTKDKKNLKPKIIADSTNSLTGKIESLELEYIVWGCACANWVTIEDSKKYEDSGLAEHCIFIEPAEKDLELPVYFDAFRHRLKVKGQFYARPDYPKGTIEGEEPLEKARVFRYVNIEVVNNPNVKPASKIQTLTLSYNAISCNCAQWTESKFDNNANNAIHYWLEPSNENLIQADTLFDGKQLPVQIKVTGQIISENGFPKRKLSKVSQDEAGKVFRYTKIEVLKNG